MFAQMGKDLHGVNILKNIIIYSIKNKYTCWIEKWFHAVLFFIIKNMVKTFMWFNVSKISFIEFQDNFCKVMCCDSV